MIGKFRARIIFSRRVSGSDGYGNEDAAFADVMEVYAEIKPLRGGEAVLAARLAGTQPVIIRVRRTAETLEIGSDWRAKDRETGIFYNITAVADMEERRRYLDIMAVSGTASG